MIESGDWYNLVDAVRRLMVDEILGARAEFHEIVADATGEPERRLGGMSGETVDDTWGAHMRDMFRERVEHVLRAEYPEESEEAYEAAFAVFVCFTVTAIV